TSISCIHLYFYFHAEYGIRDFHVTGVQTCALPISRETFRGTGATPVNRRPSFHRSHPAPYSLACIGLPHLPAAAHRMRTPGARRSEERRVGKEYRAPEAADEDTLYKQTRPIAL